MLYKGFTVYLVNEDNTERLSKLGRYVMTIPVGDTSLSNKKITGYSDLTNYVDIPEQIGSVAFYDTDAESSGNYYTYGYPRLLEAAPLAIAIQYNRTSMVGNRILLYNDSGYYALSEIIPQTGAYTSFSLYDNNDTLLTSTNLALYPGGDYGTIYNFVAQTIEDGNIVSSLRILTIRASVSSSTKYSLYATITAKKTEDTVGEIIEWLNNLTQYIENTDPYAGGGYSTGGGGNGTFDDSSDIIGLDDLPSYSATDTGFVTIFNLSLPQLQSIGRYFWENIFTVSSIQDAFAQLQKAVADPFSLIMGLSIVPVIPTIGGTRNFGMGGIQLAIGEFAYVTEQFYRIDCGSLNVEPYWDAYLDFAPYTTIEIYLPFIGTHQLNTDEVMGKTINVIYDVDIMTGACVAHILCDGSVMYNFMGNCALNIPFSASDFTNTISSALSAATAVGTLLATDGASIPVTTSQMAQGIGFDLSFNDGVVSESGSNTANPNVAGIAQNVITSKPSVAKSGSLSGSAGHMSNKYPYLIMSSPKQCLPLNQKGYTGYPYYVTETLSDCSGFTNVMDIHLDNLTCTSDEKSEIMSLLTNGVLIGG